MKKILVIGKANNITAEVVSCLGPYFTTTADFGDSNFIDGMIRVSIPDLIIINLNGILSEGRDIFRLMSESFSKIPVLVLGDQTSFFTYSAFLKTDQFTQLNCSIIDSTLIRTCCTVLHLNYIDVVNINKNSNSFDNKKTVLLVDDSALQNRISKNILEPTYKVKVSMSATQAIEVINESKPDLIVLDYDMPEVDGFNFLKVLRENQKTSDIPVIFLTGIVDKEHISKVIPLKPDGYLLKPVSAEKLLARIKELIH